MYSMVTNLFRTSFGNVSNTVLNVKLVLAGLLKLWGVPLIFLRPWKSIRSVQNCDLDLQRKQSGLLEFL
jgi:hypothetical protein